MNMPGSNDVIVGQRRSNNIEALVLASQIIDTLARYKTPVGVSTLAYELDTSKARISRFLTTMLDLGWVERGPSGRGYSLGWHLLQFGQVAAANNPISKHGTAHLVELRNKTGQATMFCVPAELNAIVTLSLPGRDAPSIYVRPGAPLKFPNSATARVVCAFRDSVMEKLRRASFLPLIQGSLFSNLDAVQDSLEATRKSFFAITSNTKGDDLGAMAAPIFDADDNLLGSKARIRGTTRDSCSSPRATCQSNWARRAGTN